MGAFGKAGEDKPGDKNTEKCIGVPPYKTQVSHGGVAKGRTALDGVLPRWMQDILNNKPTVSDQERQEREEKLQNAIDAYYKRMAKLRQPNSFGRLNPVTAQDKAEILQLHRAIAEQSEWLIESKTAGPQLLQIISQATENYRAMLWYNPSEKKSIEEIEKANRTQQLDMRNEPEPETVGGVQSTRQVISYRDDNGNVATGVFTPADYHDPVGALKEGLQKLAENISDPERKAYVSTILDRTDHLKHYEYFEEKSKNAAYDLMAACHDGGFSADSVAKGLVECCGGRYKSVDDFKQDVGVDALTELAALMDKQCNRLQGVELLANGRSLGSRIDSRNSAMSTVADLLGMPNLVARSMPMTIVNSKGETVQGTFTLKAKGLDSLHPTKQDCKKYNENSMRDLKEGQGGGLKDLADLQVLDYICGNLDRHGWNMFYQFNENNKLIGVQGIDNDFSFGCNELEPKHFVDSEMQKFHLSAPSDMLVISQSAVDKVMALTPSELKYALRGYGLSDQELAQAGERLKDLKQTIQTSREYYTWLDTKGRTPEEVAAKPYQCTVPYICIVPDQDFHKIKLENVNGKIFRQARKVLRDLPKQYKENKKKHQENWSLQGKTIIDHKNRATPAGLKFWNDETKELEKLLAAGTFGQWNSWQYINMQNAARELRQYQDALYERVKNASNHTDVVTPTDLYQIQQLNWILAFNATMYINGKFSHGENFANYPPYTQNRIKIAWKVWEQANNAVKVCQSEWDQSQRNINPPQNSANAEAQQQVDSNVNQSQESKISISLSQLSNTSEEQSNSLNGEFKLAKTIYSSQTSEQKEPEQLEQSIYLSKKLKDSFSTFDGPLDLSTSLSKKPLAKSIYLSQPIIQNGNNTQITLKK